MVERGNYGEIWVLKRGRGEEGKRGRGEDGKRGGRTAVCSPRECNWLVRAMGF